MVIAQTELTAEGVRLLRRGKVRDLYEMDGRLLIVSTDRISAFDVVLPTPIPDKGKVLNGLSVFWFEKTRGIVANHLIGSEKDALPPSVQAHWDLLAGRFMVVRRTKVLPVECVVRGYLYGSAWKDYQSGGVVSGVTLPKGLILAQKLPEPIFTPSTKAETGHDLPITFEQVRETVGSELAEKIRQISLDIYRFAAEHCEKVGLLLADTKFEFGLSDDGELLLIDEVLTPDSSRFWDASTYEPGKPQENFDKQFVRDYLESLGWNKEPPAPELPDEIVQKTRQRYREAYRRITGRELES
ncbi:MAG: phosphoribosylaminoimidazolesuccinocarboxamide synthase [Armatimonadetes bacterium]|nr:phosphoribosylaminoimidazolesuccinocarboxamide synthase [Armatimonadota bacterium]MDW8121268.1 phosphoribosylaminoimidazolesuccinocarboxamide synthase [Armatimonadota bacterium]